MNNDNYNVKELRKRYDIPTKQAPVLKLKGDGDLKGSSVGTKDLEFTFVENQKKTSSLQIRSNIHQARMIIMSQNKYQIESDNEKGNSEETSTEYKKDVK